MELMVTIAPCPGWRGGQRFDDGIGRLGGAGTEIGTFTRGHLSAHPWRDPCGVPAGNSAHGVILACRPARPGRRSVGCAARDEVVVGLTGEE
jgi:hypothetical protein